MGGFVSEHANIGELRSLLRDNAGSLKVAIDVDNTIAMVIPVWFEIASRATGKLFVPEHHASYDFKDIGSTYEEMLPHYVTAWRDYHNQIPFSGNVGHIEELANHYVVHLLTTRSPDDNGLTGGTVPAMREWLRIQGLGKVPVETCDPSISKVTFDYHVYIDDSPSLALEIAETPGKFILLVDHKFNERVPNSSRVLHVANSEKATRILLDLTWENTHIAKRGRNKV